MQSDCMTSMLIPCNIVATCVSTDCMRLYKAVCNKILVHASAVSQMQFQLGSRTTNSFISVLVNFKSDRWCNFTAGAIDLL